MKIAGLLLICLSLLYCTTMNPGSYLKYDSYRDSYKNDTYTNTTIGFSLDFNSSWDIYALYDDLPKDYKF